MRQIAELIVMNSAWEAHLPDKIEAILDGDGARRTRAFWRTMAYSRRYFLGCLFGKQAAATEIAEVIAHRPGRTGKCVGLENVLYGATFRMTRLHSDTASNNSLPPCF